MKRILKISAILFLLIVFESCLEINQVKAQTYENLQYEITEQGGEQFITITGATNTTITELTIPEQIDGITVTRVKEYSFQNCSKLKKIVVPGTVVEVGVAAFGDDDGRFLIIDEDAYLEEYSNYPYEFSHIQWTLDDDGTLTVSGSGKMGQCGMLWENERENIKNICIKDGITDTGCLEFNACSNLISVEIPSSVKHIGRNTFEGCSSITSIEIPNSVTSIGEYAFNKCSSLKNIKIPYGVTSIENGTFSECSSLTNIELPESLTNIGEFAFSSCNSLINIKIPYEVTSIERRAFSECSSLKNIELSNSLLSLEEGAFLKCSDLTDIELPNSLTSIGNNAFFRCSNLKSIKIPYGVTSIGSNSFSECSNLTDIELPESLTSIGNDAFSECNSLKSIEIPYGLTSINGGIFYNCNNLKIIKIPNSVTSIGEYEFNFCNDYLTLIVEKNSYAENYAQNKGIKYLYIDLNDYEIPEIENQVYTGLEITPEIVIQYNGQYLVKNEDFTVEYEQNIDDGTAKIIINGIGFFEGRVEKIFEIEKRLITYTVDVQDKKYDGNDEAKIYNVSFDGLVDNDELVENIDYRISGRFENKYAGYNKIVNIYLDLLDTEKTKKYKIVNNIQVYATIENIPITFIPEIQNKIYDGTTNVNAPNVTFNGIIDEQLVRNVDYIVISNCEDINVGNYKKVTVEVSLLDTQNANNYYLENNIYETGTITIYAKEINNTEIQNIQDQVFIGKELEPIVIIKDGNTQLIENRDYTVIYKNNRNAGTGTAVITGIGNYTGTEEKQFNIKEQGIIYTTHVQNMGWQDPVCNGNLSGTSGKGLRLEGIKIKIESDIPGGIIYSTHIQNIGWQEWVSNNELSGTTGKSLRLEAIKIKLTGELVEKYDLYYRVHVQDFGWLDWAKNGELAGTASYGKRLEAIEIRLVYKEGIVPGKTTTPFKENLSVQYSSHVQNIGWQGVVKNGTLSGTSGKALRLEGLKIRIANTNYSGDIVYSTHVENIGWQSPVKNGEMAGTSGKSLRLEAMKINLTGDLAKHYDIYYRVHVQDFGWLDWAKNGEVSGTTGYAKRLEGLEIVLVEKGEKAPGITTRHEIIKGNLKSKTANIISC